ncbi:MAG TPA: hypothetical protein VGB84_06370 [Arachidicoccus sp.]
MVIILGIAYAIVLKRTSKFWLVIVVIAGAVALLLTGYHAGNIMGGWAGSNFFDGLARIAFSFPMGLLLYRLHLKPKRQISFTILAIVLTGTFCITKWNWLAECAVAIIVYPILIIFGANTVQNNTGKKYVRFWGSCLILCI